jgi:hypothetical protein
MKRNGYTGTYTLIIRRNHSKSKFVNIALHILNHITVHHKEERETRSKRIYIFPFLKSAR